MSNVRRTLAIKVQTPGGDNPLRMDLVGKGPFYRGIAVSGLALVGLGGTTPYAFTIISGGDSNGGINGLTLNADGTFSGSGDESGRFVFVAQVQDSASSVFTHSFSITFLPQLIVVRGVPPPGENLLHYSFQFIVRDLTGTTLTSGFSVTEGTEPAGLTVHSNGIYDGDPGFAAIGITYFTVTATNGADSIDIKVAHQIYGPLVAFGLEEKTYFYVGILQTAVGNSTYGPTGGLQPYQYRWDNLEDFPWLTYDYQTNVFSGIPPFDSTIGFEQTITGVVTDALGAVIDPFIFAFTPIFAQAGLDIGGVLVNAPPETGYVVLESDDGSVEITRNTSGGINLRATGTPPPGGSGIETINGVGPDSGGDLQIEGIGVDSNGSLFVEAGGGIYITGVAPDGLTSTAYSFTPTPVGYSPDVWEDMPGIGTIPPGLTVDPVTGENSGVPSAAGFFSWYVSGLESSTGATAIIHLTSTIVSTAAGWDVTVAAYTPIVWLKCNEATSSDLITDGNWGSGGGTVGMPSGTGGLTFNSAGFMPSDTSRPVIAVAAGSAYIECALASTVTCTDCSIYFAYKGSGSTSASIPWRNQGAAGTGNYFIRFDGTFCTVRIDGSDYTTSVTNASLMDNNPHLIAVVIRNSTTTVELWVDGTKAWSSSSISSTSTSDVYWSYLQNNGNGGQKIYGGLGDFVIFNSSLSDPDHGALYNAWVTP